MRRRVRQLREYDCGVACLAMAMDISYGKAMAHFDTLGFDRRRGIRQPYASNFHELERALARAGSQASRRRFSGWHQIQGPTILKIPLPGSKNWHWVFADRSRRVGLYLHDPANPTPNYMDYSPAGYCIVVGAPQA